MCGNNRVRGAASKRGWIAGSSVYTSRPAAPRWPSSSAVASASSRTRSPRAVLIRIAPRFMRASVSPLMIPLVSGLEGTCRLTISLSASNWVVSTRVAPVSRSKSGLGVRAVYRMRSPNGRARRPTAWPILPAPKRPSVRPRNSRPSSCSGCQPEQLLGLELRGRTLGLFGAGRIGQAVGRRARPFGLRILYTARTPKPDFERETGATRVDTTQLLAESDIVSLHVPSSPETKGIINGETLARMKRGAILINTARGDLVREEALATALELGHLGAAGLDVYADEPNIHPRLLAAPRTVLLPHVGSATEETRRKMAAIAIANVQAVLSGNPPLTPVYKSV